MEIEDFNNLEELAKRSKEYLKYETREVMTWCGGCGNFGIQNALKRALVLEGTAPKDVLMCFDVGCNGNGSDKVHAYTIHGLHGRVISLAAGACITNPAVKVIASAGDGATFSEGVNHLVHGVRNNYPMMFIHHNNENYGLTTGQASATTPCGQKMLGTPGKTVTDPINTLEFVLALKPSFVARCFSGDVDYMTEIFGNALKHNGFAFVEILQSCPTYNKATPEEWYAQRIKKIEDLDGYDKTDIWQARKLVANIGEEVYQGILYEDPTRIEFMETQTYRGGKRDSLVDEVTHVDISGLI